MITDAIAVLRSILTGTFKVGADISLGDITELYYTRSSSAAPPSYQRYRFYLEHGTPRSYHEKRAGTHWPLTDADITCSGSMELSEETWGAFLKHIQGGTVTKRKKHVETGSTGPWVYLYWKGDRSKYQEYTFPSSSARASFEAFCAGLVMSQETP